MRRPSLLPFALAVLVAVGGASHVASAQPPDRERERNRDREKPVENRAISLDEAVARAERRYKARAVRAETKRHGDRIEYRIRLLGDDGRVFEVRVDAGSGRQN
jgi:uncharacterized membrane protein YkoI